MTFLKPEWWDEWTYYDKETLSTKLKEDAPPKVRREWNEIQKMMFPEIPEIPSE